MILTGLWLRAILDSRARLTVEAEVRLDGEHAGRGSSARAIAPGRRERRRADHRRPGPIPPTPALAGLVGTRIDGQRALDTDLDRWCRAGELGADVAVAVSLAHARARAARDRRPLALLLAELAGTVPRLPRLLVNVFSGGIHTPESPDGFQQVMALPDTGSLVTDMEVACQVFAAAERLCDRRFGRCPLSDSSGLLVPVDSAAQLELLATAIDDAGHRPACGLGVDVAAEHLRDQDGRYRFGGATLPVDDFAARLGALAGDAPLRYLEDPFDPADEPAWRAMRRSLPEVALVGDDLFASSAARLDPTLASGVLLKPTQAGTVTALLDTAAAARSVGLLVVLSHRSGETDDTAVSDLAVALGADLIKVGGPRRGDRLANYNQLLRLADALPGRVPAPPSPIRDPKESLCR
jgi:enolase